MPTTPSALRYLLCVTASVLLSVGASGARGDDAKQERLKALNEQLAETRAQSQKAQAELAAQTKALWQKQHDLEYKDPEAVRLRERIKQVESELIALRRELDARLKSVDEIRAVIKEREGLVKNLQDLKETERLIRNEITSLEYQLSSEP